MKYKIVLSTLIWPILVVLLTNIRSVSEVHKEYSPPLSPRVVPDSVHDSADYAWLEREDFLSYFWPSLRQLSRDSVALAVENRAHSDAGESETGSSISDFSYYTIERRESDFLGSTYSLLYEIGYRSYVQWGPDVVYFVQHPDSVRIFPLNPFVAESYPVIIITEPDDKNTLMNKMIDSSALAYVSSDLISLPSDSLQAIRFAVDILP